MTLTARLAIGTGLVLLIISQSSSALPQPSFRFATIGADLPDPQVGDVLQDAAGFIWFTTGSALVRHDGYEFLALRHDPEDERSIAAGQPYQLALDGSAGLFVTVGSGIDRLDFASGRFARLVPPSPERRPFIGLLRHSDGSLWAATWGAGVFRIDPTDGELTQYLPTRLGADGEQHDHASMLFEDSRRQLWIGTAGGLYSWDREDDSLDYHPHPGHPKIPPQLMNMTAMAEIEPGRYWVATPIGPYLFSGDTGSFQALESWLERYQPGEWRKELQETFAVQIDDGGRVWFSSDRRGIDIYDPSTGSYVNVPADPNGRLGLAHANVGSIFVDRDGVFWIGTLSGLNRLDQRTMRFRTWPEDPEGDGGPSTNKLNRVFEDSSRVLWVGTDNALERLDPDTGRWSRHPIDPDADPTKPPFNWVHGIDEDDQGRLWIGSSGKINRFDRSAGRFDSWRLVRGVKFAQDDGTGRLWLAYGGDGLARFDPDTGDEQHFFESHPDHPSYVTDGYHPFCRHRAPDGTIWFGTSKGLMRWHPRDPEALEEVALAGATDPDSGDPYVTRILPAPEGALYLATDRGLIVFSPVNGIIARHDVASGLPLEQIVDMAEDQQGRLWLGTEDGLILFDPKSGEHQLYTSDDGLPADEIVHGGMMTRRNGEIVIATAAGLLSIDPSEFPALRDAPRVALAGVWINNRPLRSLAIAPGTGDTPTSAPLTMDHRDYTVRFEFTALDFADPGRNQYAYRLDGLDDDWITVSPDRRSATYTTLPAGDYTFRVKAANRDGIWNEAGIGLPMTVLPPPWRTWWAYLLYVVAGLTAVTLLVAARTRAARRRAAELEVEVSNRTQEIDGQRKTIEAQAARLETLLETKNRLFADLSHEFRTPLTLISGPLSEALAKADEPEMYEKLDMATRSSHRLARLVDQLLDLARIDAGQSPSRDPQPLGAIVDSQVRAFRSLAEKRGLSLEAGRIENRWVACGADALEKILSNLLSNAIKFTPENGQVRVSVEGWTGGMVRLQIVDTGAGIPEALQSDVFQRFRRGVERGEHVPGAGIGLALVRELAEACDGRIELSSTPGHGTTVSVYLPEVADPGDTAAGEPRPTDTTLLELRTLEPAPDRASATGEGSQAPMVLLIEDSSELRAYLPMVLGSSYQCIDAPDGEAGLENARETVPDLIVCDAMLPGIDGFDVCYALKSDPRTSHIPVLMLTARADDASRIKGLERRADDYLTKPFDNDELRLRVRNLIEARETMRRRFGRQLFLETGESVELADPEKAFLEKLERVVESMYQESETTAADIAREMAMSLRQLQRKTKAVTDFTPAEYLRNYRLARGKGLLAAGMASGRVAFEVGFTSQSYFARCFRALYGKSPTAVRNEGNGKED